MIPNEKAETSNWANDDCIFKHSKVFIAKTTNHSSHSVREKPKKADFIQLL